MFRAVTREDEWLWGWDPTPGIVSVWAEADGRAVVWRRVEGRLLREEARFRPWMLLSARELLPEPLPRGFDVEVLEGPGALRWLASAEDGRVLAQAILRQASRLLGRAVGHVRALGDDVVLALPPEEQYLVATGRTYFRDLAFSDLRRAQLDLETTGLDPAHDRLFLVAVRDPDGRARTLEVDGEGDRAEAALIVRLVQWIRDVDPDVIENHNLHGFDLPFLVERARRLGVPLALGRAGAPGLRKRPSARGAALGPGKIERDEEDDPMRRARYTVIGRELVDSMDAVRRYDFAVRDLPGHGLKAVARHLGLAREGRIEIPGAEIAATYRKDPERVRRYAMDDVDDAEGLARVLGGAAFALAKMAPRRYERLADAGPATGVLDPLLVRAYVRARSALPAHEGGDGTQHQGAALHLFAFGVARRVVKADVASLYPSLMREHRIGPARDRLGALLALVDRLVDQRLEAKARGRAAPKGSRERHENEALSAAMKLVINSAYGYLGAAGLTRFSDVHAANEVTRHGRALLGEICRGLAARGMTLLEADTDGVYFSVPEGFTEDDERRVIGEVAALLPARVKLEHDGRYAAMLSHEPKNYALRGYDGALSLKGVAFRSSRAEPFGERFLREAVDALFDDDVPRVREVYVRTVLAIRRRALPTYDVTTKARLQKTASEYEVSRRERRELVYEALLAAGRTEWSLGERVRVYRAAGGRAALWSDEDEESAERGEHSSPGGDPRDYDTDYYARILRESFAARLERALPPEVYAATFDDPMQPSLFEASLAGARPTLTIVQTGR
ncbi:MAG: DNA polymerase domain-containing protein [Sandaracinus sp.]